MEEFLVALQGAGMEQLQRWASNLINPKFAERMYELCRLVLCNQPCPFTGMGIDSRAGLEAGIRDLHWVLTQRVADLTTQLEEGQALTIMVQAKEGLSKLVVARCL